MAERNRPPAGELLFELVAAAAGINLLANGFYELVLSFSPGQESLRATAVGKILGGISVLVVDYREVTHRV